MTAEEPIPGWSLRSALQLFQMFRAGVAKPSIARPRRTTDDRLLMTIERLLTTAEVAASIRVSRQTVTSWIRERQLSAITIKVSGRKTYRVPESRSREFVHRYVEGLD